MKQPEHRNEDKRRRGTRKYKETGSAAKTLRSLRRCGNEALQIFSLFPLPQRNKVRNGSQRKT